MFNRTARTVLLTAMSVGLGGGYGCRKADDGAARPTAKKPAAKQVVAAPGIEPTLERTADKAPPVPPGKAAKQAARPKSVASAGPGQPASDVTAKPTPQKREKVAEPKTARKAPQKVSTKPKLTIPSLGLKITTVAEKQVNDAEADLLARWDKIQSVAAVIRTELHQEKTATRMQQTRETAGRFSVKKKDGVTLVKFVELRRSQVERAEDDWVLMGQRVTSVNDGKYAYSLDELPKTVTAVKHNLPLRILHLGGPELFRDIRSFYGVRLKDDEVIDGKTARVFEVTRRGGKFTGRYFIDTETGLLLKREVNNERDRYTRNTTVSEVVIDATFSEDHFILKLPDGVELEDKTK